MQIDIYDLLYKKYKIDKPIRLIELFGGYGSQSLALKYLGVDYESYKLCEWAIKSIQAYKDIHFTNDNTDYSKDYTKKEIIDYLFNLGISSNYNDPMKLDQIKRFKEDKLRNIYNNIKTTHNLVNIQQAEGKDLEIVDKDKYEYIMTYSFPCQDLSLAGKRAGMDKDSNTRSGMLWEVERILDELKEVNSLPQILLMENVIQVHGAGNEDNFKYWCNKLESLGYMNHWQDLIATDYGIPQTRNRTFMISILGEYTYNFPEPIPLKLKLKDMLENNVDEKYFLSDKMINYIFSKNDKYIVNENSLKINRDIACSKTTREGNTRADTSDYVTDNSFINNNDIKYNNITKNTNNYIEWGQKGMLDIDCRTYKEDKVMGTLTTRGNNKLLSSNKRLNETSKKLQDKDCQMLDCYNNKVLDNISKTIDTRISDGNNTFIAIKNATKKGYLEATYGDGIDISSRMEYHRGTVQKDKTQTISTMGGENNGVVSNDIRIRKLTPRECFRLMGVKDEDFDNVSKNQSNASLYHLAGDSLITTIMMALFSQMLDINWQEHFNNKEWWNND